MPRAPIATTRARVERIVLVLAVFCSLLLVATMRDSGAKAVVDLRAEIPPVPANVTERPAKIAAFVENEEQKPVPSAQVRVLSIRDDRAYLAAAARTDGEGKAWIAELPLGETWVLAEGEGTARASTRLVLDDGEPREVKLRLERAETLRVATVDDGGAAIEGALIEVATGDPLPFVVRTDSAGIAQISRLARPPWNIKANAAGFEAAAQSVPKVPSDAVKVTMKRLGFVDVNVVDEDGAPIPQATVLVAGSALWPARRTQADAAGRAKVGDLPRGIYDFRAVRGDLVSTGDPSISLGRGESKSLTLTVVRGRKVAVRVVNGEEEGAAPVAGANLVLAEGGLSSFPIEGKTDAQGAALLGPIGPGAALVSAQADGFVSRAGVAVPSGASPEVRIALSRGATLAGEVVDGRGYPVDGASIEVVGSTTSGEPIDESPERAAFRSAHFSWALSGPRELVPAGELGVMRGAVPGIPRGAPTVARAAVPDPWITRDDGSFRAFPIPPGRVRALVKHPAYVEGVSEYVELRPAGEGKVKVVLRSGGTVEGRVLDDRRQPLAGARIDVAATKGSLQRTTFSAKDGTFAFAAVPGDVVLSVGRPESMDDIALRSNVTVKEGERKEVELVLPGVREAVGVEVVDESGAVVDGAQVAMVSLASDAPLRRTLFTGRDGRAVFKDARGLPARFTVSHRGRAPLAKDVDAAPAELRLTLASGVRITGTVTTRRGRDRLEGAEVVLYAPLEPLRAKSDKDGVFRFEDAPQGSMRLSASHAGYARAERTIRVDAPAFADRAVSLDPIDLEEGGSAAGLVVDSRGDPVAGARVSVGAAPALVPAGRLPSGAVVTNRRGEFKIDDLPEGDVILEASAPDSARGRVTGVRIDSGRVTDRVRIAVGHPENDPTAGAPGTSGVAVAVDERGGVRISSVAAGSEAERAGLLPGDRVTAIDGQRVTTAKDARARFFGAASDEVLVEIVRGEETKKLRFPREQVQR